MALGVKIVTQKRFGVSFMCVCIHIYNLLLLLLACTL